MVIDIKGGEIETMLMIVLQVREFEKSLERDN